jgi:hypothetical protein
MVDYWKFIQILFTSQVHIVQQKENCPFLLLCVRVSVFEAEVKKCFWFNVFSLKKKTALGLF